MRDTARPGLGNGATRRRNFEHISFVSFGILARISLHGKLMARRNLGSDRRFGSWWKVQSGPYMYLAGIIRELFQEADSSNEEECESTFLCSDEHRWAVPALFQGKTSNCGTLARMVSIPSESYGLTIHYVFPRRYQCAPIRGNRRKRSDEVLSVTGRTAWRLKK
jgi:hypothetical protein